MFSVLDYATVVISFPFQLQLLIQTKIFVYFLHIKHFCPHQVIDKYWKIWKSALAGIEFSTMYPVYLQEKISIWEQELYLELNYNMATPVLHMFEAHDCVAGLNFADETEASAFADAVQSKLSILRKRFPRQNSSESIEEFSPQNLN